MARRRWVRGRPRSRNAENAEAEGSLPLTRAIDEVYQKYNCKGHKITRKVIEQFLIDSHDGEWHHGGRYAGRINYYNTQLSDEQIQALLVLSQKAKENRRRRTLQITEE